MNDYFIVKIGEVVSTDDESHGMRIKARLSQDKNRAISDIPYAFPLMPKLIQTPPKVGEAVMVFTAKASDIDSNRYYIGPIISQPQFIKQCNYNKGMGHAVDLLQGAIGKPLETIDNVPNSSGAFPNKEDVALIGRESEDVILKEGEVQIRSGARKPTSDENNVGNIQYNNEDPTYLQLKYKRNLTKDGNSVANLVSDSINLISENDASELTKAMGSNGLSEVDYNELKEKLHPLPYGDVLLKMLDIIKTAIMTHTHPYNMLPPYVENTPVEALKNWGRSTDENGLDGKLLSNTVNIS